MFIDKLKAVRTLVALASVVVLGYALVSDVTQAQKTCNIPADCNTACLSYNQPPIQGGSQRTFQTATVYKPGTASKKCGVTKIWTNPNCDGTPYRQFDAYINNACN